MKPPVWGIDTERLLDSARTQPRGIFLLHVTSPPNQEYINMLSPFQSSFRPNFSTTTALMKFTNDLFTSFDKCQPTGAIFINLSKAFDMVGHYLLLDKLHSLGFNQNSLLWFNSYLHNRQQYVSFQGLNSDYLVFEKGVPQGSTLGPLLFCLFIY